MDKHDITLMTLVGAAFYLILGLGIIGWWSSINVLFLVVVAIGVVLFSIFQTIFVFCKGNSDFSKREKNVLINLNLIPSVLFCVVFYL